MHGGENLNRGWINGESRYSGSTYRLPVAMPVTGAFAFIISLFVFSGILSVMSWDFNFFINTKLSELISPLTAWQAFTHYLSFETYEPVFKQIQALPQIYKNEIYLHTFFAIFLATPASAVVAWHFGKPRSVIRHISGIRLREGNDAIKYAQKKFLVESK